MGFYSEPVTDVTLENDAEFLYIKGDADTDGSIRLIPASFPTRNARIQNRAQGIWKSTGLNLDAGTLFLGLDVSIEAFGSQLEIHSEESSKRSLTLGIDFDDTGSDVPKTPILGEKVIRFVANSNTTGQINTSLLEIETTALFNAFRDKFYFKTGTVAATENVILEVSKGFTPGGVIIFREESPPSVWAANTEVEIELEGALTLVPGGEFLITVKSDAPFSLIGDDANGGQFFALDFQPFIFEPIISAPNGTDRFLLTVAADNIADNSGNMILNGGLAA